jgi:hypothetical protein
VGGQADMGIVEILFLAAAVIYLFGDDLTQQSRA